MHRLRTRGKSARGERDGQKESLLGDCVDQQPQQATMCTPAALHAEPGPAQDRADREGLCL